MKKMIDYINYYKQSDINYEDHDYIIGEILYRYRLQQISFTELQNGLNILKIINNDPNNQREELKEALSIFTTVVVRILMDDMIV